MQKPWGTLNPNSQHQLWSRWTFRVHGKAVPISEAKLNAARWLRQRFGSVGRAKVQERVEAGRPVFVIVAEVEGVPAHDPHYIRSTKASFAKFVEAGWGPLALGSTSIEILAGDTQAGRPPAQLVVMPSILSE